MAFRLKASATLVSYFVGAFICLILLTSLATFASSAQTLSRILDSGTAHVVAKSGLEKGVKEFKTADPEKLEGLRQIFDFRGKKAFYDLSYKYDSLSYGEKLDASNWYNDSQNAQDQKALPVRGAGEWEIFLGDIHLKEARSRVNKIQIQFSDPFSLNEDGSLGRTPNGQMTSVTVNLKSSSGNIISVKAASDQTHTIVLDDLSGCAVKGSDCRLSIALEVDDRNEFMVSFLKIKATSPAGLIKPTSDQPGTVYIISEGNYDGEKVILRYKTKLNGEYLGFEKNGLYCKDKCYEGFEDED